MNKTRRILIIILFFVSVGLLFYGFWHKSQVNEATGHKLIGLSVVLGFFVLMPLFIYHRWKDRKVADYMLTKEAIERMQDYNNSKPTEKQ